MSDQDLERRLLELEEKFQFFEDRYLTTCRAYGRRKSALYSKIEALKIRLKDLDPIIRATLAAFDKTHTWLPKTLQELDYDVLMAADRLYEPIYQAKKEAEAKKDAEPKS